MKDILKAVRFDYLTVAPFAWFGVVLSALLFGGLSLLLAPAMCAFLSIIAPFFVLPLQIVADQCGFNKLYGVLPVSRKSLVRGRFLYLFLVHLAVQLAELVIAGIAHAANLYRFLPNQESSMMKIVGDAFANRSFTLLAVFGVCVLVGICMAFVEMMTQIKGRESLLRIVFLAFSAILVTAFIIAKLVKKEILTLDLPRLPSDPAGMLLTGAAADLVLLAVCVICGEITAAAMEKREL